MTKEYAAYILRILSEIFAGAKEAPIDISAALTRKREGGASGSEDTVLSCYEHAIKFAIQEMEKKIPDQSHDLET